MPRVIMAAIAFSPRQALEAVGKHHHRERSNGRDSSSSSEELEEDLQSLREQLVRLGRAGSGLQCARHPSEPVLREEEPAKKIRTEEEEDEDEEEQEELEARPLLRASPTSLPTKQREEVLGMMKVRQALVVVYTT